MAFPLEAYLERIGYRGSPTPTEAVLEEFQRAQLATIPFENFDILLGRGICLESEVLFAKLIDSPRGGYCFELNGLLLMALQAIGFRARALLARVHTSGQPTGRTHELILATLGGRRWIVDAGFGGPCLRAPIPLEFNVVRSQQEEHFRLIEAGDFGVMLQQQSEGGWRDLYSFDLEHVCQADVAVGNHFTSTSALSRFTHTSVAALHTPAGTTTLLDRSLWRIENGAKDVLVLPEDASFVAALDTHFGIVLDAAYEELHPPGARSNRTL